MPGDAVAAFRADLDRAVRASGLSRPHLARRLGVDLGPLTGAATAPPDWDTFVAPLLHALGADAGELELWHAHHARARREDNGGPASPGPR